MASTTPSEGNGYSHSNLNPSAKIKAVDFKKVWEPVVTRLQSDPAYAYKYFFGKKSDSSADKMLSVLTSQVCKTYGIEVDKHYVKTVIFTGLWDEGRWTRIKNYAYKSDFNSWLGTVSSQILYNRLEEEGYIHRNKNTSSKVRLRLLSQPDDVREAVVNLVSLPDLSVFLKAYYVDKWKESKIKQYFRFSDELYTMTKRVAEKCLKEVLLNTEAGLFYAQEVLSSKEAIQPMDNSVGLESVGYKLLDDTIESELIDVFDFEGKGVNLERNIVKFLKRFVSHTLKWKQSDIELWQQRFIHNEPAEDIAQRIGKTRGYVDDRYCKLCRRFEKAIRRWWRISVECHQAV